jgi:hypothetical protein
MLIGLMSTRGRLTDGTNNRIGLHHTQTTSLLNRDWGFEVKPNLYTAIVAPPSQKKSPILKALAKKPLRVLEQKAREEAKKAYQQYKDTEQYYNSLSKEARAAKFPNSLPPAPPDRRKFMPSRMPPQKASASS